jgi:hypothetical protein
MDEKKASAAHAKKEGWSHHKPLSDEEEKSEGDED